jgi:hypothetical protein
MGMLLRGLVFVNIREVPAGIQGKVRGSIVLKQPELFRFVSFSCFFPILGDRSLLVAVLLTVQFFFQFFLLREGHRSRMQRNFKKVIASLADIFAFIDEQLSGTKVSCGVLCRLPGR